MIGLLEMWRRRTQFTLIALVVVLISYLVIMINGLGIGLNERAGSALRNFDADALAYPTAAELSIIRAEMPQQMADTIVGSAGDRETALLGYTAARVEADDSDLKSTAVLGFDPDTIAEPEVVQGDRISPGAPNQMLADRSFLDQTGLQVGDSIVLALRLSQVEFTVVGEVDEGYFFFQPVVYISREAWRNLKYGDVDEAPVASVVLIKGDDAKSVSGEGFEVVNKDTAFANIEGVAGQQSTVQALRAFGFIIGALVIGVFFYVLTLQKVAQHGVLKAIGASSFYIFRQLLIQVVLISVIGIAISIPLAWATGWALSQSADGVPIAFTNTAFVLTAIALLIAGIIGALFSGRQVLKVDPIIALGQQL
jgi:putative ABC transport system permease protein